VAISNNNLSAHEVLAIPELVSDWPELPQLIQKYLDEGVKVKELLEVLEVRHARRAPAYAAFFYGLKSI
jgi:hypothetical protein